jgi:hypothetical protein
MAKLSIKDGRFNPHALLAVLVRRIAADKKGEGDCFVPRNDIFIWWFQPSRPSGSAPEGVLLGFRQAQILPCPFYSFGYLVVLHTGIYPRFSLNAAMSTVLFPKRASSAAKAIKWLSRASRAPVSGARSPRIASTNRAIRPESPPP